MRTYTNYRTEFGTLTNNTASTNLDFGMILVNDSLRYLTTKYFFNERTYEVPGGTTSGVQEYPLPYNIKTIIDTYINVGNIRYRLKEVPNRAFWDDLNFTPYSSDIAEYYYIWNKKLKVFPTPSSSGNPIVINHKIRLTDLSRADYTTGTVSMTTGSTVVLGSGTNFTSNMVGMWIQVSTAPGGDNNWYEIGSYVSPVQVNLINQYQGIGGAALSYTIGEVPILGEDYQDLPLYRACQIYFTTRVIDPTRAQLFQGLYDTGFKALDAEFGSKSFSVAVTRNDEPVINPNLFQRSLTNGQ